MKQWPLYLLCLSLLGVALSADPLDPSPEYWPLSAELKTDAFIEAGSVELDKGTAFTLLRVEEGRVLGTFGRQGIHWVDLEVTDVVERARGIESGSLVKTAPNLIERCYKTLYQRSKEQGTRPIRLDDIKHAEYLLFYFAHGAAPDHRSNINEIAEAYATLRSARPRVEWIMIQEDASVFQEADPDVIAWPFMALHMSYAYSEALCLEQDEAPGGFVLTGSHGDIIARYSLGEMSVSEILEAILALEL